MEALGFAECARAAVYASHIRRVFGGSHCSYTRVAQAAKSEAIDGSAACDANGAAACVAQQLNVLLPVLLPGPREDNPAPPASFDLVAFHCSPRFVNVQVGRVGK